MKRTLPCWIFLLLLVAAGEARAVICTLDDVPAATLLLPYFEVGAPGTVNTLFSINNASAAAVLAHVVIWTDLSVPVLDFNVYLTGYDVQMVNLYDILVLGNFPQTASAGQDPADTISPKGLNSQDINFASCTGQLPINFPLSPAFLDHFQKSLTGKFSQLLGGCAGIDYQEASPILRGYATVDTVNNCTLRFPGDPGYFGAGGTGDATNHNVLWGEYFYISANHLAGGQPLVHIEADATNPQTSTPGEYTFYGRYVGWTAVDNREPLATQFAARYFLTGSIDTSLIVWRDSKVKQGAFPCNSAPAWYPLGQERIVIFDEQEHPKIPTTFPVSPQPPQQFILPFPAEAQSTTLYPPPAIATPPPPPPISLEVADHFGWVWLDLNTTVAPAGSVPPEDPAAAQAWVGVMVRQTVGANTFSLVYDAVKLDSACQATH